MGTRWMDARWRPSRVVSSTPRRNGARDCDCWGGTKRVATQHRDFAWLSASRRISQGSPARGVILSSRCGSESRMR